MRKLKEVLRLRYELGLGQRQITRSCSIVKNDLRQVPENKAACVRRSFRGPLHANAFKQRGYAGR
jgi:hypothetical protein